MKNDAVGFHRLAIQDKTGKAVWKCFCQENRKRAVLAM